MKESKLIEVLKCFSKGEIKSFEKFIISPYFVIGRDISGLFSAVRKYHPEFDSANLAKEKIFQSLFKGETYNEKKLKNLSSGLTSLAEQFLVHESIRASKTESEKILAEIYKSRKNEKLFSRTLNSLESKLQGKLFKSNECFIEEEKLARLKEEYYIGKHRFDKSVPLRIEYTEHFTLSFLISFLRKLRDRKIVLPLYGQPFESKLIDSVSESLDFDRLMISLKENQYGLLWLVEIYYNAYKCVSEPGNEKSYFRFKELFFENITKFSRMEKYFIFNDFAGFCMVNEAAGNSKYKREEFSVYKKMLEENSFSPEEGGYLAVALYRNIMLLALDLHEYDWLGNFIAVYSGELNPEYMKNMMNLANANLSFGKGSFEEALVFISKVHYDFFLYKIDVKNLMLKIYYELSLFDMAFSLIDSYRHFLASTEEISAPHKKQNSNFLIQYSKLLKVKSGAKLNEAELILIDIEKTELLSARVWLQQKALELIKSN